MSDGPHPSPELILCSHPSEWPSAWEPCPKERDHEGEHVYWRQTNPQRKRGRNGVHVVDERGAILLMADYDGAVDAEMVCAMLALLDARRRSP